MTARRNLRLALSLLVLVSGMTMLAYASVPLYRLFCQVTGFGGTTRRAAPVGTAPAGTAPASTVPAGTTTGRRIAVTLDAQVNGLDWDFRPEERQVRLRTGEERLAIFDATNRSGKPLTGTAVYNVTPDQAGRYFVKVQCFCFDRQTIGPGETTHFPVSFYVDPAIADDPDMRDVTNITLSYTFFPAANP